MPEPRRTNPGFLSNNEAARDKARTKDAVSGMLTSKEFEKKNQRRNLKPKDVIQEPNQPPESSDEEQVIALGPEFWSSNKGLIVKAIVENGAYKREDILRVTKLSDLQYRNATTALFQAGLLTQKSQGSLWVTKELYVKCKNFFNPPQPSIKIDDVEPSENHVTGKEFLLEFFGSFGRDLGTPERRFTDNPTDLFPFIEECARNKTPAFISVQPEKRKAQPFGLEKVFFDFDYCKNNDQLTEAEIQKRKAELIIEVRYFLNQLQTQNIKPLVIRTRKGYHVHVFFDSIYEINQELDF